MEGLHYLKFLIKKKTITRTLTLQIAIQIRRVQVVGQPRRISLPLVWSGPSSKNFYKIIKNSNYSFETNKHSNNCLSGRCVADGAILTANFDSEGNADFYAAKFGICHKCGKVNSSASETNGRLWELRVLGVTDKYRGNALSLSKEKLNYMIQHVRRFTLNQKFQY